MSTKLTRKGLALATGSALIGASLIGLPATAAGGYAQAPADGSNWGVFSDDAFRVDFSLSALLDQADLAALWAAKITNAESSDLELTFHDLAVDDEIDYVLYDARGIAVGDGTLTLDGDSQATLDFTPAGGDAVLAVLFGLVEDDGVEDTLSDISIEDTSLSFGDGGNTVTIRQWIDTDDDLSTVDDIATATNTLTIIDPASATASVKIVRAENDGGAQDFNENGDAGVATSVSFNKAVNLEQVDWSNWVFGITASDGDGDDADATVTADYVASYDDYDDMGYYYGITALDGDTLSAGEWYKVSVEYDNADAKTYNSSAFTVPAAPTNADFDVDGVTVDVADTANVVVAGGAVTVRSGTDAVTYVATADDGGDAVEQANIPVVAVVTAGEYLPTGSTIKVSGSTAVLNDADQTLVVSGLTNSDGEFSITVTHTGSDDGVEYEVDFYAITEAGAAAAVDAFDVAYEDTVVDAASASSDVLSGTNPTVTVSVTDQWGEAISANSDGALKVSLTATDADDLELFANVVGGSAKFTFANYLTADQIDTLSWEVFTGANDDPDLLNIGDSITLYSTRTIHGINITTTDIESVVVYEDFVTSGDEAYVAAGDAETISGTVIDANGGGVPGAQVTISAPGMQLFDSAGTEEYAVGTITVTADEGGAWEADVWTHVATDGTDITVTSGGKSAKAELVAEILSGNGANSAANYKLSWNLPTVLVYNTTYAVTATMADKWGNPIANADLEFLGTAAAEFNGSDAVVEKTTNSKGQATVYLRSLADVAGLAAVQVQVTSVDADGDGNEDADDLADTLDDNTDTAWDESAWSDTIEAEVNFLKTAPAGTGTGVVNVGSFNGKLVVYAKNLNGAKISWKVGGKWGVGTATSNYAIFNRPTPVAGATVSVDIYVNGVKTLTKSVVTR